MNAPRLWVGPVSARCRLGVGLGVGGITLPIKGRPRLQQNRAVSIEILGRASSINVRKVLWLCDELALPHVLQPWGQGVRPTDAPEFLQLNPNALVPVLRDGNFVLWESNTICRYLAGREQRHDLLPREPRERARVEQWMDWQATELNNAWRHAFLGLVRGSAAHADAAGIEASRQAWNRLMTLFDAQLQRTGAYAAGSSFTLADIVLGLATWRWLCTPIARPELPAVNAYMTLLEQRPAFHRHAAPALP